MSNAKSNLFTTYQEVFNGNPWYGDAVMKKLESLDHNHVNKVPDFMTHSIAMIVQHMISWRRFAIEKLNGNVAFDIQVNSTVDWGETEISNETEWKELLHQLQETQHEIIGFLNKMDNEEILKTQTSGRNYDFEFLFYGIIQHDIYHLGQIAIVNKYFVRE